MGRGGEWIQGEGSIQNTVLETFVPSPLLSWLWMSMMWGVAGSHATEKGEGGTWIGVG
jgi:hypothetical protein